MNPNKYHRYKMTNKNQNKETMTKITGSISKILPLEEGTSKAGKSWKKQSLVIDTGAQFNPMVCVGFFGDKVDLIKDKEVDQPISVMVNISSREYKDKWYTQCDGFAMATPEQKETDVDGNLPF